MTDELKIEKVIELIADYGFMDGEHHKIWLIDQILRTMTGCPSKGENDEYKHITGDDWDTGIAP